MRFVTECSANPPIYFCEVYNDYGAENIDEYFSFQGSLFKSKVYHIGWFSAGRCGLQYILWKD